MSVDRSTKPTTQYYDMTTAVSQGARAYQEDSLITSFAFGQNSGFAIVADGMGGHAAGDVASALVASEIFIQLSAKRDIIEAGSGKLPLVLRDAAQVANSRIADHCLHYPDHTGMGTTLLVPVFSCDKLHWLSVGDSPLLLFRDGALRMLNKDHSLAPQIDMMVKSGVMDADTGKNHPDRNTLTSVLAGDDIAKIDCPGASLTLRAGDIVIASSDGIQSLSNMTLANLLMTYENASSAQIADALLNAVLDLDQPGQDNVSFAVIKVCPRAVGDDGFNPDVMPILAVAGDEHGAAKPAAPAPAPAEKKKKTFFYRGKEYTRED